MATKVFCDACAQEIITDDDNEEARYPNLFYQVRITRFRGRERERDFLDLCIACQALLQRTVENLLDNRIAPDHPREEAR